MVIVSAAMTETIIAGVAAKAIITPGGVVVTIIMTAIITAITTADITTDGAAALIIRRATMRHPATTLRLGTMDRRAIITHRVTIRRIHLG